MKTKLTLLALTMMVSLPALARDHWDFRDVSLRRSQVSAEAQVEDKAVVQKKEDAESRQPATIEAPKNEDLEKRSMRMLDRPIHHEGRRAS